MTTNPSLFAKVGGSYDDVLQEICGITPGPVSAEVVADDVEGMLKEGRHFAKLAPNIVVKVPMSEEGLEAIARLAAEGIKTNKLLSCQAAISRPGAPSRSSRKTVRTSWRLSARIASRLDFCSVRLRAR